MAKRGRLEVIRDILLLVHNTRNGIKPTPLLRKSNLSSSRFKEYYNELEKKRFIEEKTASDGKMVLLTKKGERYIEKYAAIKGFLDEFEL